MKSLSGWSIRSRLLLGFLGILTPYFFLAGAGVVAVRALLEGAREIHEEGGTELVRVAELRSALARMSATAADYLGTGLTTERQEFERRLADAREVVARLALVVFDDPEERRSLEEALRLVPEMERLGREILAVADPGGDPVAAGNVRALERLSHTAGELLTRLEKVTLREIREDVERGQRAVRWFVVLGLAAIGGSVAGGVGLAFLFSRWLGRPLVAIANGSRRMAEGDLSQRIDPSFGGELGETTRAFNAMAEGLEASHAALRRTNEELAAINSIAGALTSTLELKQVFKVLTQGTARAVGAERCSLNLWREGHVVPVMSQFADGHADPALWAKFRAMGPYRLEDVPVHAEAIRTRRPVAIEDATASPLYPPDWVETFGIRAALVVPLVRQDQVIGTLHLDQTRGACKWSRDQIDLAVMIAGQAALAVENARLYQESEMRRQSAEALAAIGRELAQSLDLAVVSQRITDSIRQLLGLGYSRLYRLEAEAGDLVAVAMSGGGEVAVPGKLVFPKGTGAVGLAVEERRFVVSEDVFADPRITFTHELRERMEKTVRAVLAVPLFVQGRAIGALAVGDRAGRTFSDEEIRLAQAFADQAAVALENARLVEGLKSRQARIEALLAVSRDLSVIRHPKTLLGEIAEACGRLLDSDSVGFHLVEGNELVVSETWGEAGEPMPTSRIKIGQSLAGIVGATGEPLIVQNLAEDSRLLPEYREVARRLGYRHWLGVPVKAAGRLAGVLGIRTRRERGFTDEDLAMAMAFASQAAVALDNSRLHHEVQIERAELADRVRELEDALTRIRQLQGLLPICAWCRKVRDDRNYWQSVEGYVAAHSDLRFSHGICPECRERHLPTTPSCERPE